MIACHHYQPPIAINSLRVSLRHVCELLAEVIALRIEALAQLEHAHVTHGVLERMSPALLAAFQASALCVRIGDLRFVGGQTPPEALATSVIEEFAAFVARATVHPGGLQRSG